MTRDPDSPLPYFLIDTWLTSKWEEADVVVFPVPYEKTTSYRRGTALGPTAILEASGQVETYDEELNVDLTERLKVFVAEPFQPSFQKHEDALGELSRCVGPYVEKDKFLVTLGGEHSITPAIFDAIHKHWVAGKRADRVSVLQIDAHSDLRREYEGSRLNHACAMYPIAIDRGAPLLPIGIRNTSQAEAQLMREKGIEAIPPRAFRTDRFEELLSRLGEYVYITVDVDGFDPSIFPSTGTPEPGGLWWDQTLQFLRLVCERRRVLGCDIVELMPIAELHHPNFAAAKLALKLIHYCFHSQR